eukprot:jgi/Botrbrau1/17866/Bobra.0532s0003.1
MQLSLNISPGRRGSRRGPRGCRCGDSIEDEPIGAENSLSGIGGQLSIGTGDNSVRAADLIRSLEDDDDYNTVYLGAEDNPVGAAEHNAEILLLVTETGCVIAASSRLTHGIRAVAAVTLGTPLAMSVAANVAAYKTLQTSEQLRRGLKPPLYECVYDLM